MTKNEIGKIVDTAFDKAISAAQPSLNRELYPAAFPGEHTWLTVERLIKLNNTVMRNAVKSALSDVLGE